MTDAISAPISGQPASDTVRKAQLAQAVQQEVVAGGRVDAQGDYDALIRYRRQIHPVQRLVLALVTFGLWGIAARIMYRSHQFIKQMTPLTAFGARLRGAGAYHVLNLIFTLVTFGLWGVIVTRVRHRARRLGEHTVALDVDELGNVRRQPVV
jgi:hypothetical protein